MGPPRPLKRRPVALAAALVLAMGAVVAFLAPCDAPTNDDAPHAPRVERAAAPATASTTRRRVRVAEDAPAASDPPKPERRRSAPLKDGVSVAIEVIDSATGRSIPEAEVSFRWQAFSDFRGDPDFDAVTDEDGRAAANLPAGTTLPATIRAQGYAEAIDCVRTAPLGAPQPTLRVALARAGTLRGIVRTPDGGPVFGTKVYLVVEGADGALESDPTGNDGSYRVDGLAFGTTYVARASPPDATTPRWCESAAADVVATAERPECSADLRLLRSGTLDVEVLDATAGEDPLRSIQMRLVGESSATSWSGRYGAKSPHTLAAGRHTLSVWADDRVPFVESLDVTEGATLTRTIRLSRGESVSGTVVDEVGAPVEDAEVRTATWPAGEGPPQPRTMTGEDGRFTLALLPEGTHDLLVSPPYDLEEISVPAVPAPSSNARFVVRRRGTLALRMVFDDDARPAADARIAFRATRDGEPWEIDRTLPSDGRFEVAWPVAVRGEIGIAVDGFVPVTRSVDVPLGARIDVGELRLRPACSIRGTVRDAQGRLARGVEVSVPGAWRGGTYRSDHTGRFSLHGLTPGSVLVTLPGVAGCSFRVDVPRREDVLLTLPRTGLLQIVLVGATGAPVAGRRVVVRDGEGEIALEDTTDVSGEVRRFTAPGRYLVEVERGPSADVEIRADDITLVKLR